MTPLRCPPAIPCVDRCAGCSSIPKTRVEIPRVWTHVDASIRAGLAAGGTPNIPAVTRPADGVRVIVSSLPRWSLHPSWCPAPDRWRLSMCHYITAGPKRPLGHAARASGSAGLPSDYTAQRARTPPRGVTMPSQNWLAGGGTVWLATSPSVPVRPCPVSNANCAPFEARPRTTCSTTIVGVVARVQGAANLTENERA